MSDTKVAPPVTHIPTQTCTACGNPALGGCDRCLTHLEPDESDDWLIDDETAKLLEEIES